MASVTRGKDEKAAAGGEGSPAAGGAKGPSSADLEKDLHEGEDDAVKAPDAPGSAAGKGAAADYRRKEEKLQKRTGGYFTVYKKGQGYWTRMGTVIGAAVLGLMLAYTIFDKVAATDKKLGAEVAAGFIVVYVAVAWYYTNKPANVDFLIATDSEMKKVNWTSRKELIGSTQVVILFMFLIALFLFAVDEVWGWLMYLFHVLKVKPFGM